MPYFFSQIIGLQIVIQIMLEGSNNLGASTDIDKLKDFVFCSNLYLFPDYDEINFQSQTFKIQIFLIIIISSSFL